MKFIKKLSKRTRIISLMVLLVMVSATTVAFLQDYTSTITNSFSIKSIHTEIEENNHDTTLTKAPFVKNTDVTDVMVRIRLEISGDFSQFALAGIDTGYAVGSENFDELPGEGEEITFYECGTYIKDEMSDKYWTAVMQDGENKYSCYYYYNKVLKANDEKSTLDVTQPLFDRILLRVIENGETNYISYNEASHEQKKEFAALEKVKISIYQESVPLEVKYDNSTLKADVDENDNVNIDGSGTKAIWDYFMSNQNGE